MAKVLLFNNIVSEDGGGADDEILVLPAYDLVCTYSSWSERIMKFEWKCDAKDSTIDHFRVERDTTLKGKVNVRAYDDTSFSRYTTYKYKVTPVYINGESGGGVVLMIRSPRDIGDTTPTRVEKVLKSTITTKMSFLTDKPYVAFMPCNSYIVGDIEDTEIIEID